MYKFGLPLLCGSISLLTASVVMAQSSQGLEEITVTARKRAESLQDVPVAVSAISSTALRNNAVSDLSSIGELAPQVTIGRAVNGTGAVLTIRGISSATVDAGLDQSVMVDLDGVPLSRGRVVQTAMFDMQQIEVMEGPQALFFGKNSPAGVISITSKDPTDTFSGYARAGYEFKANEKYVEAAASAPITNDLKARLALRGDWMDGWIKNIARAEANPFQPAAPLPGAANGTDIGPKGHDISGRLTLIWSPAGDFSAKLKLTMSSERQNANDAYSEPFCTGGQTVPIELGVAQNPVNCSANMVKAISNLPAALAVNYPDGNGGVPYSRSDLGLASLTLNKTVGDIALTSTTGYYDQATKGAALADFSEFAQIFDSEAERYRLISQELRANTNLSGPLNAMAGAYYEHSHRRWVNTPDILNIFNPVGQSYASQTSSSVSNSDSYSVFAQLRWKIIPSLELAGGARYSHDDKKFVIMNLLSNPNNFLYTTYPDNTPINSHYKGNNVSPDVTLTWKPEDHQTLYAAYKTGYKAGGISNQFFVPPSATSTNLLFGPEKVKGFEVGYKADLLANTLRVDMTAYRYNYNGLQVSAYEPLQFSSSIKNAAKARTTGVSGSFEWLATDQLSFNGNIGFNHARYLDFANSQCYIGETAAQGCIGGIQSLRGKALNRAPDLTFKIGADYKANLMAGWTADFSVSGAYSSSYQAETDNGPGGFQPSYWLLNAAVHLGPESEKYQLSLIGRNLTNTYYKIVTFQQTLGTANQYAGFFNRPREVVLEATYNF